jgi:hypothetical protein
MSHWPQHARPTAERAYHRARVLLAVTARALFELLPERWPEITRLRAWMMRESLWSDAEPNEVALLNATPGELAPRDAIDGGWRIEGVAVLCWSLGLAPLPALDEQAEPSRYRACLGFLVAAPSVAIALRPSPELEAYFEQTARDRHLLLRQLAGWATNELADVALTIDGRSVTEAGDDEIRRVASAAHERCIAAGWLLGRAASYAGVAATF